MGWNTASVVHADRMFYGSNVTGDVFKAWALPAVKTCHDFCVDCVPPAAAACAPAPEVSRAHFRSS